MVKYLGRAPMTVPCLSSTNSFKRPILSQMFVKANYMAACLILYYGNWTDLRDVTENFEHIVYWSQQQGVKLYIPAPGSYL